MPKKWEVWRAVVKFEDDPSQCKERPVIVIDKNVCFFPSLKVTTHEPRYNKFPGEYCLIEWKEAGLDKESTVRCSHLLKLVESDFVAKIGVLQPIDIYNIRLLLSNLQGRQ